MKIVKFEKDHCPYCVMATNHLKNAGVEAVSKRPYDNEDDLNEFIPYGVMAFPLIVLLDDNGQAIKQSVGYNVKELDEMIDAVKS